MIGSSRVSVIVGLSVLSLTTASVADEPCYPDFRCETLPLYMHVRKADAFMDEELEYLASFPLITLEKATGARSSGSTDQGTSDSARAKLDSLYGLDKRID